jgi:subtilisin family serine protease
MGPNGEWWFTAWQIPKVWQAGARGQGVTVAVIDSGVQADWPELSGVVLPGTDFQGGDARVDRSQSDFGDSHGHGTAMALEIAGQGGPFGLVGVAPEAKILPVQWHRGDSGVGEQIRWAVDHGAKVINMSYFIGGSCSDDDQAAVRYAIDRGAVVVTAAGNDGATSVRGNGRPTNCLGVLAVSAIDNQLQVWAKSDRGPYVSLAAPGVHIQAITLARERAHADGTSDSAALTSGAIALVWSKYPQLTNRQVVARLLATTRDLGAPGKDDLFGYGGVRPYQAVTADVPADAANPIFDQLPAASPSSAGAGAPASSTSTAGAGSTSGGGSGGLVLVVAGVGGVALLGAVVVAVVVGSSRRRARQGVSAPPSHTGWPPPGGGPY